MSADHVVIVEQVEPDLIVVSEGVEGKRGRKGDKGDAGTGEGTGSSQGVEVVFDSNSTIIVDGSHHGKLYVSTAIESTYVDVVVLDSFDFDGENYVDAPGKIICFTQSSPASLYFYPAEGSEILITHPVDRSPRTNGEGSSVCLISLNGTTWQLMGDLAPLYTSA